MMASVVQHFWHTTKSSLIRYLADMPATRQYARFAMTVLGLWTNDALGGHVKGCPTNTPLSCGSATATDTCCTNVPGGLLLQTQFWDYSPSTGPTDSWTVHGLWPDNCDGTYQQ